MTKQQRFYLLIVTLLLVILTGVWWFINNQQQKEQTANALKDLRLSSLIVTDRVETAEELAAQSAECEKAEGLIDQTQQYFGSESDKSKKLSEYAAICKEYVSYVKPYQYKTEKLETDEYKNLLTYEGACAQNGCAGVENYPGLAVVYRDIQRNYKSSYDSLKDVPSAFTDEAYKPYSEALKAQLKSFLEMNEAYAAVFEGKSQENLNDLATKGQTIDEETARTIKTLSGGAFGDYASFFKDYLTKSEASLKN